MIDDIVSVGDVLDGRHADSLVRGAGRGRVFRVRGSSPRGRTAARGQRDVVGDEVSREGGLADVVVRVTATLVRAVLPQELAQFQRELRRGKDAHERIEVDHRPGSLLGTRVEHITRSETRRTKKTAQSGGR